MNRIRTALFVVIGLLFCYSGFSKLMDLGAFHKSIEHFRMLPELIVTAATHLLPWLELLCGMALLTGVLRSGALLILMSLLGVFTVAIVSAWIRGLDVSCGCFGENSGDAGGGYLLSVMRNGILMATIGLLLATHNRRSETCPES